MTTTLYARDLSGNLLGCIPIEELQRWRLLLDHLADWLSRADRATCEHYRRVSTASYLRRDTNLFDMFCELCRFSDRLGQLVAGAAPTTTSTSTVVSVQADEVDQLVWVLEVIANWLECLAADATRADLARFLDSPARGTVHHLIDTAAGWAEQLRRRRAGDGCAHHHRPTGRWR